MADAIVNGYSLAKEKTLPRTRSGDGWNASAVPLEGDPLDSKEAEAVAKQARFSPLPASPKVLHTIHSSSACR